MKRKENGEWMISRSVPLGTNLKELVTQLQHLLDIGAHPETKVLVFDGDTNCYEFLCHGELRPSDRTMLLGYCDDQDVEMARWQNKIRDMVIECSGCQTIDGSGCDSGDPLDLTLSEIQQGFNYIEDLKSE